MDKIQQTALVLTYHVKNSKRVGGFHYFITFLQRAGYNVDWVTLPVSITWLLRRNDRENAKNFISISKGYSLTDGNSEIRCFSTPILIPAKMARVLKMRLGDEYWPRWDQLRKKLRNRYDLILFEGVACQYAEMLKRDYPNAKVIYRPSDVLATFSQMPCPEKMEINAINQSDVTACVDENEIKYYKQIGAEEKKLMVLHNPLTSCNDITFLKSFVPKNNNPIKTVVYMGVSFCNFEYIEFAAQQNKECVFYIIGPFNRKSHDNVMYTGSMTREEYEKIIMCADVAIAPNTETSYKAKYEIRYGFTGKIITYMKFLLPIVATCSSNYLNVDGFFCVDTKEEFSKRISKCLKYSSEDRLNFRDGYLRAMKCFLESQVEKDFSNMINK